MIQKAADTQQPSPRPRGSRKPILLHTPTKHTIPRTFFFRMWVHFIEQWFPNFLEFFRFLCFLLLDVVPSSLKCTVCVTRTYKLNLKLIWFDIVSRTLDIIIGTLGNHREKVEYLWSERIQKEVALIPDQLALRCLSNQPSKAWWWANQGKQSGHFCPSFSMHFKFLLLSHLSVPLSSPRKCFSSGLKPVYLL